MRFGGWELVLSDLVYSILLRHEVCVDRYLGVLTVACLQ